MISLPYDSLFPELYTNVKDRAQVNTLKEVYGIFGLLAAFLLSGFLIGNINQMGGYLLNGIVTSVICGVSLVLSLKWGVTERAEFKLDHKLSFGFFEGLKYVFKNKGFVLYTIMYTAYEYTLLVLAAIVPQYAVYILHVTSAFQTSLLLGLLFIVGLVTVPIWTKLDVKLGSRRGLMIAVFAYLIASIPLLFVTNYSAAMTVVGFMGFGYGGMMYFIYLIIADVVDEDELKTKVRREGNFFGITTFFMRLSGVLSYLTISIVFIGNDWSSYQIISGTNVQAALLALIFVAPAIALIVILICLKFYPFTKEKVDGMKAQLEELHKQKLDRVSGLDINKRSEDGQSSPDELSEN
jgi:GPH family glycoside/pentoside/hexuronide:cation symporter